MHQFYEFLNESLDEATKKTMMTESSKYMLTVNGTTYKDGPLFLKAILLKISVETNATDFYLRESLHELPAKIKELNYDIKSFNDYVKVPKSLILLQEAKKQPISLSTCSSHTSQSRMSSSIIISLTRKRHMMKALQSHPPC